VLVNVARQLLESLGYEVLIAKSGREAIEILEKK